MGYLLISPDYRNYGIGSEILKILEEYIVSEGGKSIGIVVDEQNTKGLKFWKRNGFFKYDERKSDKIIGSKEFLMRKILIKYN